MPPPNVFTSLSLDLLIGMLHELKKISIYRSLLDWSNANLSSLPRAMLSVPKGPNVPYGRNDYKIQTKSVVKD